MLRIMDYDTRSADLAVASALSGLWRVSTRQMLKKAGIAAARVQFDDFKN